MNTTLLRAIRQKSADAVRWTIPGFGHGVTYHRRHSFWKVAAVSWPAVVGDHEILRSARLDWHRTVIKNELRRLLKQVVEAPGNV